jgi:NAD(P)-dependent dehydrogenase (short-subunit alcohol dehydrogenase family)
MNLISPLWFAIRVYRQMRSQDGVGSIINISSGTGHPAGSPTLVSYGAAKAGLNHLTRSLAEEWGPHARVNSLALGPTMTDNFQSLVLPKDDPQGEAYFINGTTIEIDGGMLPGVLYDAGLKTITDLL